MPALYEAGIPYTQFDPDDVEESCLQLTAPGVTFSVTPTKMDSVKTATPGDACGNHIQLVEML